MSEIRVEVSESLECDGSSIKATDEDGNLLPVRMVGERRVYRTAFITWAITIPEEDTMKKKVKIKKTPKIFQSGATKGSIRNRQRRRTPRK